MESQIQDHYAVLGVLPDAEHVVIVAAYRALAQRYHPDRNRGESSSAHDRMSEINAAYRILSDPSSRSKYDAELKNRKRNSFAEGRGRSSDEEFTPGFAEIEERWQIACSVLPDLRELRERVAKISKSLESTFLSVIIESKSFDQREVLAERLIEEYLRHHFGEVDLIVGYARRLLVSDRKNEAQSLSQLVSVLGEAVPAQSIIERLEYQFPDLAKDRIVEEQKRERIDRLLRAVHFDSSYEAAKQVSEEFGFCVERQFSGFLGLGSSIVNVTKDGEAIGSFKGQASFCRWVNTYIRSIVSSS